MSGQQSKADLIAERQANLPLPDQPPVASDFNSADARTVNIGSGGQNSQGDSALPDPATGNGASTTGLQNVGREGQDHLGGLPRDALSGKALHGKKAGVETRQPDYGYPQKHDPSSAHDPTGKQ